LGKIQRGNRNTGFFLREAEMFNSKVLTIGVALVLSSCAQPDDIKQEAYQRANDANSTISTRGYFNENSDIQLIKRQNYELADIYTARARDMEAADRAVNLTFLFGAIGVALTAPQLSGELLATNYLGARVIGEVNRYANPKFGAVAFRMAAREASCFNSVVVKFQTKEPNGSTTNLGLQKKNYLLENMRISQAHLRTRLVREDVSVVTVLGRLIQADEPSGQTNIILGEKVKALRKAAKAEKIPFQVDIVDCLEG
jgi:hypothetical protein